MDQSTLIQAVVREVLTQLGSSGISAPRASSGALGVFKSVNDAVDAAGRAQEQLVAKGVAARRGICEILKRIPVQNADSWARIELDETKVGRLDHKILKLKGLPAVPGVEMLETHATSGDRGLFIDEFAPWGVIGAITPVTHSIPTLTCNAINMVAAGNAVVFNAHPSGANCAAMAVREYNKAIAEAFGIENLLCIIDPPTLESANAIFEHKDIPLLCITGGPAVARAAMAQRKRAIVGGPGNPPVVVDETADLERAAKSIIWGGAFDNNLLCIGEKQVFVVESVFDQMMDAMTRAGAVRLNKGQIEQLTKRAFVVKDNHHAVNKELVGKDAYELCDAAGAGCARSVDLLYGETEEKSPWVFEEQMMPFVPFVRVPHVDAAIDAAVRSEHGFGHTAIIHSNKLDNITRFARAANTTLFVVNGPCTASLGDGDAFPSYTIATPTGEGVTNPLTFTRFRRMAINGSLRIL